MYIDIGSLFFNTKLDVEGNTMSWGTALGQSKPDYPLDYPGSSEILIAMNFKYIPLSDSISYKGKGGSEIKALSSQNPNSKYEVRMAALFEKTFVKLNGKRIAIKKPFILLVVKENEGKNAGRKTLKYSGSITNGKVKNEDFYKEVSLKLGGSENTCWFAYSIDIENHDELVFSVVKVADRVQRYADGDARKKAGFALIPEPLRSIVISKGRIPKMTVDRKDNYAQDIYYGVPGSGKSKIVNDNLSSVDEYIRIVFHADYSNADFVGQILPETIDGNIQYKYKPSPFIQMLRDAYMNPEKKYALVIEELNRGNAPAIFGPLFQLLDRKTRKEQIIKDKETGNYYDIGWSDYSVALENVNAYFRTADGYASPEEKLVLGGITITAKEGIRFPKNLAIYATMNTSDQNVFSLDNAFQRRWNMHLVSSELNDSRQKGLFIATTGVTWDKFRKAMNDRIVKASSFSSLEDKRLGGWFVQDDTTIKVNGKDCPCISEDLFTNKVIKYLWDDAFKLDRNIFVDYERKTLEQVVEDFKSKKMEIFDSDFVAEINK